MMNDTVLVTVRTNAGSVGMTKAEVLARIGKYFTGHVVELRVNEQLVKRGLGAKVANGDLCCQSVGDAFSPQTITIELGDNLGSAELDGTTLILWWQDAQGRECEAKLLPPR